MKLKSPGIMLWNNRFLKLHVLGFSGSSGPFQSSTILVRFWSSCCAIVVRSSTRMGLGFFKVWGSRFAGVTRRHIKIDGYSIGGLRESWFEIKVRFSVIRKLIN